MKTLEHLIRDVMSNISERGVYKSFATVVREQFTLSKAQAAKHHKGKGKNFIEMDPNDQIAVGTYKTKHFEMSPDAQKFFATLPRDSDLDKAEKMIILHDKLFAMHKQLKVQKGASNDEKRQAHDLVKQIRQIGGVLGVNDKMKYLDKHLDEINKFDSEKDASKTLPKSQTSEPMDRDIDNSRLPISRAAKMQRKIKIIDED